MEIERPYTVYKHTNKENGKVYVGITRRTPERRWQRGAGYVGTLFGNAIRKYGWDNFEHEIIATSLTKNEACSMEIELIAKHRSNEYEYGYNKSCGGETTDCINPRSGKENPKAVAVTRIDPNIGEKRYYETIAAAVVDMGINHRGISKACRGVSKTYMGYVWEYSENPFDKPQRPPRGKYPHTKQCKKIQCIETDGSVKEYESLNAASAATGIRAKTIGRYVDGTRHDRSGRRWEPI